MRKLLFVLFALPCISQGQIAAKLYADKPASHLYTVEMSFHNLQHPGLLVHMPVWTTGYYQYLHFARYVKNFHAYTSTGDTLAWHKPDENSWWIKSSADGIIRIRYEVQSTRPFVATNFLDTDRAYVSPAGMFVYPEAGKSQPVTVQVIPAANWKKVATGLTAVKGRPYTYVASDFDVLYDSPILMGDLEAFPQFTVKGIPHDFIAYKPGLFDKAAFMQDMQKIVSTASGIIGDIPYDHYVFLGIGPGGGGIEHLNSASVAFEGSRLPAPDAKLRLYNFLAHEYFHHYNVKRIRPFELGPFDYLHGSRTNMLWLSEGITVYYELLIVKRAGLIARDELLHEFSQSVHDYETKPGRQFQTPADASYTTWEDGPFGRTGDDVNKTISPYDKGPALGMLLDFKIRHETKNKASLDTLMRVLYRKYYQGMHRGFTDAEFRETAETVAGVSLADFFDYIYTLKPVDYPLYLNYAGLSIDTSEHILPGGWIGLQTRDMRDTVFVSSVEWHSPAWEAGIRPRQAILQWQGAPVKSSADLQKLIQTLQPGATAQLQVVKNGQVIQHTLTATRKKERSYLIEPIDHPDTLQKTILDSWLGE